MLTFISIHHASQTTVDSPSDTTDHTVDHSTVVASQPVSIASMLQKIEPSDSHGAVAGLIEAGEVIALTPVMVVGSALAVAAGAAAIGVGAAGAIALGTGVVASWPITYIYHFVKRRIVV